MVFLPFLTFVSFILVRKKIFFNGCAFIRSFVYSLDSVIVIDEKKLIQTKIKIICKFSLNPEISK